MPKLQINVSEEFAKQLDIELTKAAIDRFPNDKPPKLANLIPTALIWYANKVGAGVAPELKTEAEEILTRKPGPQKKKPVQSHDLFDERPGTWLSSVAIDTGCAMVTCGENSLSLAGCWVFAAAAEMAFRQGWGAIPETKQTSNGPMLGIRFIPPGTDFAPKTTPAPAPMALADVGAWVSEASILQRDQVVLNDCRVVEYDAKAAIPGDMIRVHKAVTLSDKPDQKTFAILKSITSAQSMAYQLGWTMRKETKNGSPGILLIPPRVKLTYEIAPGRTVPVTQ